MASPDSYRTLISADIAACISKMGCQPILFIGSGLSRRYFSGPSWEELLAFLAKQCPLIDKDYAYYKQTLVSPLAIGREFARLYQEWAWGKGRSQFPADMFQSNVQPDAYIKLKIAEHLAGITPKEILAIDAAFKDEIAALLSIRPHAIITTNYDQLLEVLFPEYQPIIGQKVISGSTVLYGELFKIHGCVSDPNSLVFTQQDYDQFIKKKKYLSAKLVTYFSEHPLLFVGYSATNSNIRAILSDIDEILLSETDGVIPNVYILEWNKAAGAKAPAQERLIEIEGAKSVRVKAIEADDFKWVFDAFSCGQPLNSISPKVLRTLLHRSYDLVRHDIPRQRVDADFQMLEHAVQSGADFAKLFGITTVSDPSASNANYPHTITMLAEHLFGPDTNWNQVNVMISKLKKEHGVDIKTSDNRYHITTKTGKKSSNS